MRPTAANGDESENVDCTGRVAEKGLGFRNCWNVLFDPCASFLLRSEAFVAGAMICLLGLVATGTPSEAPPGTLTFAPSPGSLGVGPNAVLSWSFEEGRMVPNGGFESGLEGWEFRGVPANRPAAVVTNLGSDSAPVPALEGTHALRITVGQAVLPISLPPLGTNAALGISFSERGGLGLSTGLEFIPEDTAVPGATLLHPVVGLFNLPGSGSAWRRRGTDLTRFAGQRGALVWTFPNADLVPWFLDDVRWELLPHGVRFQVWLSADAQPLGTPETLLGSTERLAWPMADLRPNTLHRWRVDVVRDSGTVIGPEVSFRTAPAGVESLLMFEGASIAPCPGAITAFALRVVDERGFGRVSGPITVDAQAVTAQTRPPSVRITEVDLRAADAVECRNLSEQPIDLSGWRLELFQRNDRTQPSLSIILPEGSVLPPGAHFLAQENRPASSRWPILRLPGVDWMDQGFQPMGVLLRDAGNEIVDAFFMDPTAASPSEAAPGTQSQIVDAGQWLGRPVTNRPSGSLTFQRLGERDTNTRQDWGLQEATLLAAHPALRFPALPGASRAAAAPASPRSLSSASAGGRMWFGLALPDPVPDTQLLLRIQPNGRPAEFLLTPPLPFAGNGCLELILPDRLPVGTGSSDPVGRLRLSRPADQDTEIQLAASWPMARATKLPLAFPTRVRIPAGARETPLPLSYPDDGILTGPRTVVLRASAEGFAPTLAGVSLADQQTATMQVEIPARIQEGTTAFGILRVDRIVADALEIALTNTQPDLVRLPASVRLDAGESEASFQISAPDDGLLNGDFHVRITARFPDWPPASGEIERVDNDRALLRLSDPFSTPLGEGTRRTMELSLGGILDHPLEVSLSVRPANAAQLPGLLVVPAGTNRVAFSLEVPEDDLTNGLRTITLSAQAPGFESASLALAVRDNDPARLRFDLPLGPYTNGIPFLFSVSLETLDGQRVGETVWDLPQLQLAAQDGATFETLSVEFVSGVYGVTGRVQGTGEALRLESVSTRFPGISLPFPVWEPPRVPADVLWAYFDEPRNQFVVIPGFPGALWQFIDGADGRVTSLIPSPIGTGRVVPTADGDHLAIIHHASEYLQSLDLRSRTPSFDIPLGAAFPGHRRAALDLAPVVGLSNSVVVARFDGTNNQRGGHLTLFRDGALEETLWPLPTLSVSSALAIDGSRAEVTLLTAGMLSFHPVVSEGVGAPRIAPLPAPCPDESTMFPFPHPAAVQFGGVLTLPCLERVDTRLPGYFTPRSRSFSEMPRALDPRSGRLALLTPTASRQWRFELYSPHAAQRLWLLDPVPSLQQPTWIAPAGPDRWLIVDGYQLRLLSTPAWSTQPKADLSVTVEILRQDSEQGSVDLVMRIENRGPGSAPSVALEFSRDGLDGLATRTLGAPTTRMEGTMLSQDMHTVGDLTPGTHIDVPISFRAPFPAFLRRLVGALFVSSQAEDPVPENNRAEFRIEDITPGPVPSLSIARTNVPTLSGPSPRVVIRFQSVTNHQYQLETQRDIDRHWVAEVGALAGDGRTLELLLPLSAREMPKVWRLRRDWPPP